MPKKRTTPAGPLTAFDAFIRHVELKREAVGDFKRYPFSIPAVKHLDKLELDPRITFFVGENGSGKSTLIEGIAVAAGFNPEGGSRNHNFATRRSDSDLHAFLKVVRGVKRPKTEFFLRAESFFNVATNIEEIDMVHAYGGVSLHEQSHGESFLALVTNRFGPNGLYILDEPEAALSPQRQLSLLRVMHDLIAQGSQFIVATHSPLLLAYPDARIYQLGGSGIETVRYEETEHYALTRDFLMDPARYLRRLFE
ncbi:MAG: AAA family ATPase [Myxococcaceae bacterium]